MQVRKTESQWIAPLCKGLLYGTLVAGAIGILASFSRDSKRQKLGETSLEVSRFTGELWQNVCNC